MLLRICKFTGFCSHLFLLIFLNFVNVLFDLMASYYAVAAAVAHVTQAGAPAACNLSSHLVAPRLLDSGTVSLPVALLCFRYFTIFSRELCQHRTGISHKVCFIFPNNTAPQITIFSSLKMGLNHQNLLFALTNNATLSFFEYFKLELREKLL